MIIVTRPSPYGEELVKQLTQAGIEAKHCPLFSIIPGGELSQLSAKINKLQAGDSIIVVSPQVLNILSAASLVLNFPANLQYMAIGEATAKLFSKLTSARVIYPQNDENSENLLSLPELSQVNDKQVLILRGNGGRELLGSILQSKGAKVEYCECYQRIPITYPRTEIDQWENDTSIIITSLESLLNLDLCVTSKQRSLCTLIISSPRIANKAKQLGWNNCRLSNSANNQILFKTIMTVCHNESNDNT